MEHVDVVLPAQVEIISRDQRPKRVTPGERTVQVSNQSSTMKRLAIASSIKSSRGIRQPSGLRPGLRPTKTAREAHDR
jgi:hypothetical protein